MCHLPYWPFNQVWKRLLLSKTMVCVLLYIALHMSTAITFSLSLSLSLSLDPFRIQVLNPLRINLDWTADILEFTKISS